jgi:hypothetical protein
MLKRIIHPSALLVSFMAGLELALSKPQRQHIERTVEGIIVCEERSTLSALYRLWVDAPDVSAVADCFRNSPWQGSQIQERLAGWVLSDLVQRAKAEGAKPIFFVSIDDSLSQKDKGTKALEAADLVHNHAASGKGQPAYCKGAVHVSCRIQCGRFSYTFGWRLYLRERTVRRLNRERAKEQRLRFRTKNALAQEMLKDLKRHLPKGYKVYVLFDSWYAAAKTIRWIRREGWHVICALKGNRTLNGIRVGQWDQRLKHKRYGRASVTAADGTKRTYFVRALKGRLSDIPSDVCVVISKRHPREKNPKYFLCTDLTLKPQEILSYYGYRWPIEVDYWFVKEVLGLDDFRMQPYEAIQKWYAVVHLAWTFLQWRFYEVSAKQQQVRSVADVIRLHRTEHAREVLRAACDEALRTGSIDAVLDRFAPLPMAA